MHILGSLIGGTGISIGGFAGAIAGRDLDRLAIDQCLQRAKALEANPDPVALEKLATRVFAQIVSDLALEED